MCSGERVLCVFLFLNLNFTGPGVARSCCCSRCPCSFDGVHTVFAVADVPFVAIALAVVPFVALALSLTPVASTLAVVTIVKLTQALVMLSALLNILKYLILEILHPIGFGKYLA
jgi:hypothetical protein